MSIQPFPLLPIHYHADDSSLLNGGQLFFYEAGTPDTIQPVYTDHTGLVEYEQPVVLNARGEPPTEGVYGSSLLSYKIVLKTSGGVTLKTIDGFVFPPGGDGGVEVHNDLTGRSDSSCHPISAITGLAEELALFANEDQVVHNFGDESIAGIKTFVDKPVVPNASFTIAKTTGLQSALDGKVSKTGNETIAGVKTFSSSPVVPDASFTIAKTIGLQDALDAKVNDSDVVHLTGDETIAGKKSFSDPYTSFGDDGDGANRTLIHNDGAGAGYVLLNSATAYVQSDVVGGQASTRASHIETNNMATASIAASSTGSPSWNLTRQVGEYHDVHSASITLDPDSGDAILRKSSQINPDSTLIFPSLAPSVTETIATEESQASLLALKQTVFNGVCQIQYLTENDIEFDCTGVTPVFRILTVKNGTTISASNPLCFYTDGDGMADKWTFDAPQEIPFTYTLGAWGVYCNNLGVLVADQLPWTDFSLIAPIARIYIDPALSGSARNVTEIVEYHKNDISASDHQWKHIYAGTIHLNGLDLVANVMTISATGVPTAPPNIGGLNTVVGVTSGRTEDENLTVNIVNSTTPAKFSQDLGPILPASLTVSNSALFKMSYNDAVGTLKMLPATRFPFSFNASTNIPEYITTAGVRTSVTNKAWMVNYIYSFGDPRFGEVVKVRSSNVEYLTYTNALSATWSDLQAVYPTLRDQEIRPLYKLIHYVEHSLGGAYNVAVKFCALVSSSDIRKQQVVIPPSAVGTVLASSVSVVPTGAIASTNVQSALAELDAETIHTTGVDQTVTNSGFLNLVRSTVGTIQEWFYGAVSKFKVTDVLATFTIPVTAKSYQATVQTVTITAGAASVDLSAGSNIIAGSQLTAATQFTFTNSIAGMRCILHFVQDAATARNITLTKTSGAWLLVGATGFSATTLTIASTLIPTLSASYAVQFDWETATTCRVSILK